MGDATDMLCLRVEQHMKMLQKLFVDGTKITLLVRLPEDDEADMVITGDHLPDVRKMVDRCIARAEENPS